MSLARPLSFVVLAASLALQSCSSGDDAGGSAPVMQPLTDQVAYVDSEFTLALAASDADGDALQFGFSADIADISKRASINQAEGNAVFVWSPLASDVGIHAFDFTASDGKHTASQTITIDVRPGSSNAPVFRQPLGTGTTLDLTQKPCLEMEVLVEDPDSPGVQIAQEGPPIAGSELTQYSEFAANWSWCPSKEQIAGSDRFVLKLSADDGTNPKVYKNFLIVLRKAYNPNCKGEAPRIDHEARDASTVVNLPISAEVSDDLGIKYEPLLYYSTTEPGNPPDLAQMTQLTMTLKSGDMLKGVWSAEVPNPVASKPAGSSAKLHYVIVAVDNDDPSGDCDHMTQAPQSGAFVMTVTNPGGQGGLGLCQPCASDAQCGGEADHCVYVAGEPVCARACSSDSDCKQQGFGCSEAPVTSVDGQSSRQCLPKSNSCADPQPGECTDDSFEPNDTIDQAVDNPGLLPGTYDSLKSCPAGTGANEDWYPIDIEHDTHVNVTLHGTASSDLDLALINPYGEVLARSEKLGSDEVLSLCVTKGYYFVRVFSWDSAPNSYSLSYQATEQSCSATCDNDSDEPDDDPTQARLADLSDGPYISLTNAICPHDEDWFLVNLFAGEPVYVQLTFWQANAKEDLDVILYYEQANGTVVPLMNCTEHDPSGCTNNGQSSDSHERLVWQAEHAGWYYVVVRGWDGASNLYDICIGLSGDECPAP